jgi:two-component system response regulator HydG
MTLPSSRLLELLNFDPNEGAIRWKHRRMLLHDADAMGLLRRELVEGLGQPGAKRLLTRFGYACGYRDALASRDLLPWKHQDQLWELGPWLVMQEGNGFGRIVRSRVGGPEHTFEVEVEWLHSYEAEQHRQHVERIPACPVCWSLCGYASGYSSALLGREVFYYETECLGKGDQRCYMRGISADQDNRQGSRLKTLYDVEEIEAGLSEVVSSLDRIAKDLQAEHEKVSLLEDQVEILQSAITHGAGDDELVGSHPRFRQVIKDVARAAPTSITVLIYGETGTGKELIARAIHAQSDRRNRPLVTVNCAALPHELVESELFGHEKGAFTGAFARKLGRFEIANGGTIFLDEIGELPLATQSKLLRVLQEREFERLGATSTCHVDVRVIAATNRKLDALVGEGKFRMDLYYRLNVFPITLPTLAERIEDISILANYFVRRFSNQFRKSIRGIDPRSMTMLMEYPWPGNIRELEHVIERAVLTSDERVLQISGLSPNLHASETESRVRQLSSGSIPRTLAEAEKYHIVSTLQLTNGLLAGKGGAAEMLGIPPSTLRNRMKKLGLKSRANSFMEI